MNELAASPTLVASVNVSPASTVDPDWWNGLGALLRGPEQQACAFEVARGRGRLVVVPSEAFANCRLGTAGNADMLARLAADANANLIVLGDFNEWTRGLASQLPKETLGKTPFYYEAANIHHQPSSASAWLVEQKKTVSEWLDGLLEHAELMEERSGSARMRLLDLHCPALPGLRHPPRPT